MPANETLPLPDQLTIRVRRVELRVTSGPDKGRSALLSQGSLSIGTQPDCELWLTDPTVSSMHCEVTRQGERLVLRDLGSTNGVLLDGVQVREAFPKPGARIRLGKTELQLKSLEEEDVPISNARRFGPLIGSSPAMRAVFAQLEAVARSAAALIIEGETGSGKNLAAEAVHHASSRSGGPFVLFDCGAVAPNLIEAELFGHARGAFTGAQTSRPGLAAEADGGTLALDEICELPLELQPKLLRLIEQRELRPVGANEPRTVDVRIIACTHRSIRAEVEAGRFREDLYYRLAALTVRMPPLRERLEDLPALIDGLLEQQGASRRFRDLADGDRALLLSHRWPGNVRELRNVVERLLAFPESGVGTLLDNGARAGAAPSRELLPLPLARAKAQDEFEYGYLKTVLALAEGSISEAARIGGVSRQFLQRILRKHGLR